jgi:hypothetical protein
MDLVWVLDVAIAAAVGFGVMMMVKADAISRISKAKADAIRRKAEYDFRKDENDTGN